MHTISSVILRFFSHTRHQKITSPIYLVFIFDTTLNIKGWSCRSQCKAPTMGTLKFGSPKPTKHPTHWHINAVQTLVTPWYLQPLPAMGPYIDSCILADTLLLCTLNYGHMLLCVFWTDLPTTVQPFTFRQSCHGLVNCSLQAGFSVMLIPPHHQGKSGDAMGLSGGLHSTDALEGGVLPWLQTSRRMLGLMGVATRQYSWGNCFVFWDLNVTPPPTCPCSVGDGYHSANTSITGPWIIITCRMTRSSSHRLSTQNSGNLLW